MREADHAGAGTPKLQELKKRLASAADGMNDVAFLAVGIVQQRQVRAAVRVVFDGRTSRARLPCSRREVITLTIGFLVAAARGGKSRFRRGCFARRTLLRFQQRLFRLLLGDVALVHDGDEPPRRRIGLKSSSVPSAGPLAF